MRKVFPVIFAVCLFAGCACTMCTARNAGHSVAREVFQPAPDLHVAEREHLDGGFSRDYGFWMRSYSHTWSDAHTHSGYGATVEERQDQFTRLHNAMYEINITNSAVFCYDEAGLAFAAAREGDAPVWFTAANNPDISKLREYHEKYNIRGVKIHNTRVIKSESLGEDWEFPAGSGQMVPVSIDYMVSPEWMEFFKVCDELDILLIFHSNNRYGASPYNFGGQNERYYKNLAYDNEYILSHVKQILTTYPDLDFMLAHAGFMGYRKLAGLFREYPNLYVDTSAAFVLQDGDYLTDAERERIRPFFIEWSDRILFGTDANAGADLSGGNTEEHQIRRHVYHRIRPHKNFIHALYLPQDALDRITHENFERLYKTERSDTWYW